jgi:hypothetical protein
VTVTDLDAIIDHHFAPIAFLADARDWELLRAIEDEDGSFTIEAIPILAFGVTAGGVIRPLAADDLDGDPASASCSVT